MICYWGNFIDSSGTSVSRDVLHRLPEEKGGLTKSLFVSQAEEFAVFYILYGTSHPYTPEVINQSLGSNDVMCFRS